jgi:hypothetical protein
MNLGDSESTALNKAFIPALAGAASTYLLTAAGGTQGIEALLRQPAFKENFRQRFKAVAAGSVKEGLREEAPDQLIQGMIVQRLSRLPPIDYHYLPSLHIFYLHSQITAQTI